MTAWLLVSSQLLLLRFVAMNAFLVFKCHFHGNYTIFLRFYPRHFIDFVFFYSVTVFNKFSFSFKSPTQICNKLWSTTKSQLRALNRVECNHFRFTVQHKQAHVSFPTHNFLKLFISRLHSASACSKYLS